MNLTTKQVAEKLHISTSGVNDLRQRNLLTDIAPAASNGKSRHAFLFDSKQVNELAKTYRSRMANRKVKPVTTNHSGPLGIFSFFEKIDKDLAQIEVLSKKVDKLTFNLDQAIRDIDQLVKIWS